MAGQFIGVAGVARKVKDQFAGVGGVARKIKSGYIGVGGVARNCYGGAVHVSGSGLNYGQTIPNWTRVKGTVTVEGTGSVYHNTRRVGTLWLEPETVNIDVSGTTCTYTVNSRHVYIDWNDDFYLNHVTLDLTFGTSAISGFFVVNYDYNESNCIETRVDLSDFNVSFDLTFET